MLSPCEHGSVDNAASQTKQQSCWLSVRPRNNRRTPGRARIDTLQQRPLIPPVSGLPRGRRAGTRFPRPRISGMVHIAGDRVTSRGNASATPYNVEWSCMLPRPGTMSLQFALERLLEAPSYHMTEMIGHLDQAKTWRAALQGRSPDWTAFLTGYAAALDRPVVQMRRELSATYPDAVVLLSRRDSAAAWYRSMEKTVLLVVAQARQSRTAPARTALRGRSRRAGCLARRQNNESRSLRWSRCKAMRPSPMPMTALGSWRPTTSTWPRFAMMSRATGWSSGSRVTDGSRSARCSVRRCPRSPSRR